MDDMETRFREAEATQHIDEFEDPYNEAESDNADLDNKAKKFIRLISNLLSQ